MVAKKTNAIKYQLLDKCNSSPVSKTNAAAHTAAQTAWDKRK